VRRPTPIDRTLNRARRDLRCRSDRGLNPCQFQIGTCPVQQGAEPEGVCCRWRTTRKCQSVITIPIGSCKHPVADLYL
jgi:hypothetical protein